MNIITQAADLASAVGEFLNDECRVASPEVQAEREAICKACPYQQNNGMACTRCACGMNPLLSFIGLNMATKRSMPLSACPDGRWPAV